MPRVQMRKFKLCEHWTARFTRCYFKALGVFHGKPACSAHLKRPRPEPEYDPPKPKRPPMSCPLCNEAVRKNQRHCPCGWRR
jgi:hypothetical protein